jgi:hypothetical protein
VTKRWRLIICLALDLLPWAGLVLGLGSWLLWRAVIYVPPNLD